MYRMALPLLLALAAQDATEDNPEYKAWAKQKPGAWVKWTVETQTGVMKMTNELTWTLKEVAADRVVIEELTTLTVGGSKQEHTRVVTHSAKIKKGTTSDGSKIESTKEGEEIVKIKDRQLRCRWSEMKLADKQGGTVRVYKADEIPGGAAKVVIKHDEAAKMTLTMIVVDWRVE